MGHPICVRNMLLLQTQLLAVLAIPSLSVNPPAAPPDCRIFFCWLPPPLMPPPSNPHPPSAPYPQLPPPIPYDPYPRPSPSLPPPSYSSAHVAATTDDSGKELYSVLGVAASPQLPPPILHHLCPQSSPSLLPLPDSSAHVAYTTEEFETFVLGVAASFAVLATLCFVYFSGKNRQVERTLYAPECGRPGIVLARLQECLFSVEDTCKSCILITWHIVSGRKYRGQNCRNAHCIEMQDNDGDEDNDEGDAKQDHDPRRRQLISNSV